MKKSLWQEANTPQYTPIGVVGFVSFVGKDGFERLSIWWWIFFSIFMLVVLNWYWREIVKKNLNK